MCVAFYLCILIQLHFFYIKIIKYLFSKLMQKQSSQQPIPQQKVEHPKQQSTKEQKPKKEKKEQTQPIAKKDEQPTPELFAQIDMRVGEIKECWKHPESDKLWCEKIQVFGEVREIASGLQQHVPQQQMSGNVLVMVNLKPRPLAGFQSNGMVVCASNQQHTVIQLLRPNGKLDERLVLQGHQQLFTDEKVAIINPKKKILERCLPLFKTDGDGFVVWNGIRVKIGGEYLKSDIAKGNVS